MQSHFIAKQNYLIIFSNKFNVMYCNIKLTSTGFNSHTSLIVQCVRKRHILSAYEATYCFDK